MNYNSSTLPEISKKTWNTSFNSFYILNRTILIRKKHCHFNSNHDMNVPITGMNLQSWSFFKKKTQSTKIFFDTIAKMLYIYSVCLRLIFSKNWTCIT